MEEIEIPNGAISFLEGVFYKLMDGRLFYYNNEAWRISTRQIKDVEKDIKKNPSLLLSIRETVLEWDDHHNCNR